MGNNLSINNNLLKILKFFLDSERIHVRALAKKLKMNHKTVLNQMRALEKGGVLVSRLVGRNKEYSVNKNVKRYFDIAKVFESGLYVNNNLLRILGYYADGCSKRIHVRELARKLKMNHKTVLNQMKILEREGVMVSMMVGRNKECSVNLEGRLTKKYIEMARMYKNEE